MTCRGDDEDNDGDCTDHYDNDENCDIHDNDDDDDHVMMMMIIT